MLRATHENKDTYKLPETIQQISCKIRTRKFLMSTHPSWVCCFANDPWRSLEWIRLIENTVNSRPQGFADNCSGCNQPVFSLRGHFFTVAPSDLQTQGKLPLSFPTFIKIPRSGFSWARRNFEYGKTFTALPLLAWRATSFSLFWTWLVLMPASDACPHVKVICQEAVEANMSVRSSCMSTFLFSEYFLHNFYALTLSLIKTQRKSLSQKLFDITLGGQEISKWISECINCFRKWYKKWVHLRIAKSNFVTHYTQNNIFMAKMHPYEASCNKACLSLNPAQD